MHQQARWAFQLPFEVGGPLLVSFALRRHIGTLWAFQTGMRHGRSPWVETFNDSLQGFVLH